MAFATLTDFRERWPNIEAEDMAVRHRLDDATAWLQALYPAIPDTPSERLGGLLRMIVCSMASRALMVSSQGGVASDMTVAGPFTHQVAYRNAEGNLYLTAQEKELLDAAMGEITGRSTGFMSIEAQGW